MLWTIVQAFTFTWNSRVHVRLVVDMVIEIDTSNTHLLGTRPRTPTPSRE